MNSSSSSLQGLKLETLCISLESQKRLLTVLTETIEKHKKELDFSLALLNHYRLKEKKQCSVLIIEGMKYGVSKGATYPLDVVSLCSGMD